MQISGSPTITCCVFSHNRAIGDGGGIDNIGSPRITNCVFSLNNADRHGGGIYCTRGSPTLGNCTFGGNVGSQEGGAMYDGEQSNLALSNCILWDNNPAEISGTPDVSYSNVRGGWPGE